MFIRRLVFPAAFILFLSHSFLIANSETPILTWAQMRKLSSPDKKTAALVPLDHKTVKITGFMVALEGSEKGIKDFLLVPVAGMCIHLPAPPPNQSVYVRMKGSQLADHSWEAVRVIGKLTIKRSDSEYGDSYFFIEADKVY